MLAAIAVYVPHLHHAPIDWLCMAVIALAMAAPSLVARARHELWRRRVLSAMR